KPNLSPQQTKQHTLEVLCNRVYRLAREKPVLFVCEDAHWIDRSSLEFLEMIVRRAVATRVLVVITQRPGRRAPFVDGPHVSVLQLGRLGRRHIAQLIRYVAASDVPDAIVENVMGRTDGIPLFVEEMTRSLVESGFTPGASTGDIPETLQASL